MMNHTPLSTQDLMSALRNNANLPVIFAADKQTIQPGYHLTEVKYVAVDSLDCGQAHTQWHELIIQLLDGNAESKAGYMQANKFLHILEKALASKATNAHAQLFFEFAPSNGALQKLSVRSIDVTDNTLAITLSSLVAQCKLFERTVGRPASTSGSAGCCAS